LHVPTSGKPGSANVRLRLCELVFVEALRRYLGDLPETAGGWLAGLRDPSVCNALALLHADPARSWTIESLARAALQQLDPLWDELFPAEQARIVALLVGRVDIGMDGLNVQLRMDGLGGLAREMLAGDIGKAA
jgi:hypothetical protein